MVIIKESSSPMWKHFGKIFFFQCLQWDMIWLCTQTDTAHRHGLTESFKYAQHNTTQCTCHVRSCHISHLYRKQPERLYNCISRLLNRNLTSDRHLITATVFNFWQLVEALLREFWVKLLPSHLTFFLKRTSWYLQLFIKEPDIMWHSWSHLVQMI